MAPTPLPSCTEVLASSEAQADGPEGLRSLGTTLPTVTGRRKTQTSSRHVQKGRRRKRRVSEEKS